MKDSQYITHDIGARNDPKLVDLQMAMGGLGLGIWWCLVEMLWENDGYLPLNYRSIAYSLKWAKAKDVERVVTEFGLFENDGQRIWNRSALERIQHKRRVSATRAVAGQAGGIASSRSREANAKQMLDAGSAVEANAKQMLSKCPEINKLNNKLINQESNNSISLASTDAEKRDIYRLFFFKNFRHPEREVERFLDRYEGNWCRTGSTIPERDHMKLARTWKPEDKEPRFKDPLALDWFKRFAAWVTGHGVDSDTFLRNVAYLTVDSSSCMNVVMTNRDWRDTVTRTSIGMTPEEEQAIKLPFHGIKITC